MADPVSQRRAWLPQTAEILVIVAAAACVLVGSAGRPMGELATSRLATIYSLTHDGSWYIDRPADCPPNPYEQNTIDKVRVAGHLVSSKPPMLTLWMTAEYVVLRPILGWDLDDDGEARQFLRVATITILGGGYLLTLLAFRALVAVLGVGGWARVFLLASLAFGTQLLGFSTILNNHVPAAGMVMLALYQAIAILSGAKRPAAWRFGVFGLAAGLVATLDVPGTIFPAFAGLALLVRFPRQAMLWAGIGAALPLAIHAGVLTAVTGAPVPVQTRWDLYLGEDSYWRHPTGIDGLNEPKLTYLFHMTFGRKGIFVLFPVLLGGLAGAIKALIRRDTPWRRTVLAGAAAFIILTAYYAATTNNYGGEMYGFRWYIVAMPVLLLMSAPLFLVKRSKTARWLFATFLALMLAVSCYSSHECAHTGYKSSQEWTCRIFGPSFE